MNIIELHEKWQKTGLLKGLSEERSVSIATCLHTQNKLNERANSPNFVRCSIPVVRRVLPVVNNVFINRDFEESVDRANFHVFKTKWNPPSFSSQYNIVADAEYVASFSESLVKEINELFKDQPKSEFAFYGFVANSDVNGQVMMYYA